MCKEGWCIRLGQEGDEWGWEITVGNTLKEGGTGKRGGNKDLKKEDKLGQGVGALKNGRQEVPYRLWQYINVWLSMMSGHTTNPIFFNKKNKDIQNTC